MSGLFQAVFQPRSAGCHHVVMARLSVLTSVERSHARSVHVHPDIRGSVCPPIVGVPDTASGRKQGQTLPSVRTITRCFGFAAATAHTVNPTMRACEINMVQREFKNKELLASAKFLHPIPCRTAPSLKKCAARAVDYRMGEGGTLFYRWRRNAVLDRPHVTLQSRSVSPSVANIILYSSRPCCSLHSLVHFATLASSTCRAAVTSGGSWGVLNIKSRWCAP